MKKMNFARIDRIISCDRIHTRRVPVRRGLFGCVWLLSTLICSAAAQEPTRSIDPVSVSPEIFTVLLENEAVRVVSYRLEPGEHDEWHTHPAKVSYTVSGGTLRIHLDDGSSFVVEEKSNTATWMDRLGKHYAENIGNTTVHIVLVEVKSAAQGATMPEPQSP